MAPLDDPPRRPPHAAASLAPVARRRGAVPVRPRQVSGPAYADFLREVAEAQLRDWLPERPGTLLDLSDDDGRRARLARVAGHRVLRWTERPAGPGPAAVADPADLGWLAPESLDAVVAEGRTLSRTLVTEHCLDGLVRALRPGGRVLLAVDSLLAGMSRLAAQQRWAELADVPAADVVLVPDERGRLARCFWPEELRRVLQQAGLDVEWVRPRSVLSPEAVDQALTADPQQLRRLVATETALAADREGDAHGAQLVASARRP